MAEKFPSDADLAALSGVTDTDSGLPHPTIAQVNWYTWLLKLTDWLDRVLTRTASALRVYQDGDLTFAVRPGRFLNGQAIVTYAGATEQALTDDDTNYIYLTAAGALTVNVTGFPLYTATPHIRLATIAVGSESAAEVSSEYAPEDIADWRDIAMTQPAGPQFSISVADDADGTGTATIQSTAGRQLVRAWIGTADFGAPVAQTDFSVTTGTELSERTADADYEVISDATGLVVMNIIAADATYYVMAEIDGRIYSKAVTITGN